jgi:hypothetical protein
VVEHLGPNASRLLKYWQQLPQRGSIPDRRDFDPMAIVPVLPFITLLERVTDSEWRLRVIGTEVERRWRGKYTGHNYLTLDIVSAQAANVMLREFRTITQWPCGSWSRRNVEFRSGRRVAIETLRLPLRAIDGNIAQIISSSEEFGNRAGFATDRPSGIIEITEQRFVDIGAGAPTKRAGVRTSSCEDPSSLHHQRNRDRGEGGGGDP